MARGREWLCDNGVSVAAASRGCVCVALSVCLRVCVFVSECLLRVDGRRVGVCMGPSG